jgi:hypothetical protein
LKRSSFVLLLASFALVTIAGCGPSGPETVRVTGNVTFEGAPVSEGDIVFIPPEPTGLSTAARITNGVYTMDATPGEKKVEIRATRVVPGKANTDNPGSTEPAMEMFIPTKYNTETTLKQTVPPEGGTIDFALTK